VVRARSARCALSLSAAPDRSACLATSRVARSRLGYAGRSTRAVP
jgi:hypothetical protein